MGDSERVRCELYKLGSRVTVSERWEPSPHRVGRIFEPCPQASVPSLLSIRQHASPSPPSKPASLCLFSFRAGEPLLLINQTPVPPLQGTNTHTDTWRFDDGLFKVIPFDNKGQLKEAFNISNLCTHSSCEVMFGHCPYSVSYVSSETSTSGILLEDVLHLKTEGHDPKFVEAYITFG